MSDSIFFLAKKPFWLCLLTFIHSIQWDLIMLHLNCYCDEFRSIKLWQLINHQIISIKCSYWVYIYILMENFLKSNYLKRCFWNFENRFKCWITSFYVIVLAFNIGLINFIFFLLQSIHHESFFLSWNFTLILFHYKSQLFFGRLPFLRSILPIICNWLIIFENQTL